MKLPPAFRSFPALTEFGAGISVAMLLIPQSLAYASLAGVPPIAAISAAIFAPIAAAFFASSPFVQTGPTALTALLTVGVLSAMPGLSPEEYALAAALLALLVGIVRLALGIARLGQIAYFMSLPVLRGFTAAAALIIVFSQLPVALGLPSSANTWSGISTVFTQPWSVGAAIASVVVIVVLRLGKRFPPMFPTALVVIVAGLLFAVMGVDLGPTLGTVSGRLPAFNINLPWAEFPQLAMGAVIIAIAGFSEPTAIARSLSEPGQQWSASKEFISQGVANLATSVFSGFPVGASFARSALAKTAGGKTNITGFISGVTVLALVPLLPVLSNLPRAVLAAVIIGSVFPLVQIRPLIELWRYARTQGGTALLTFALTLILSPRVDYALVIGIALALAIHLMREANLDVKVTFDGNVTHVELGGVLWFGSLERLERLVAKVEGQLEAGNELIIDATPLGRADLSSLMTLFAAEQRLTKRFVTVEIIGLPARAERVYRRLQQGTYYEVETDADAATKQRTQDG